MNLTEASNLTITQAQQQQLSSELQHCKINLTEVSNLIIIQAQQQQLSSELQHCKINLTEVRNLTNIQAQQQQLSSELQHCKINLTEVSNLTIIQEQASVKIVSHREPLYTGDIVTLRCCTRCNYRDYDWYRNNNKISHYNKDIPIYLPDEAGQYQCKGSDYYWQGTYLSPNLNIRGLDLPSAAVNTFSDGPLYSGESVTLQCDISDYTDWTYWWYRDDQPQSPGSPSRTITTLSDQVNQYQCQGTRTGRPQSSQRSGSLHITVTESSGWRFYWYRHIYDSKPVETTSGSSYTLNQVNQYQSEGRRTDRPHWSQRSVPSTSLSLVSRYQCEGRRTDRPHWSQRSVSLHITVTGSCRNRIFKSIHHQSTNQDPQQDQGPTQVQSPDAGYTRLKYGQCFSPDR
ncbi:hypothetical protein DPEC_G00099060 [Dallia pectoralis]|uniref:Uncharacterized protein n=1 Tax=Dallia pectoralis TaxID=75939 RepID=A0ACC2GWC5_DALPE|nr:hypothetical protein DPEC_G00099060 [Dallia pectoralis]